MSCFSKRLVSENSKWNMSRLRILGVHNEIYKILRDKYKRLWVDLYVWPQNCAHQDFSPTLSTFT